MVNGRRVVVVGCGIVGASAALHLAEQGAEVTVVDDERLGRATGAGAGIVSWPWRDPDRPGHELRRRSVQTYAALAQRIGAAFDVIGELMVAATDEALEERAEALRAGGAGAFQRLSPREARDRCGFLAPELAALHLASTARVEGEEMRVRLRDAALAAGAELVAGPAQLTGDAEAVTGVRVRERLIAADAVLVAAGPWSAQLLAAVGITIALAPQRGQILHLGVAVDTAAMPAVAPVAAAHYLLPFADRRIVVGATRETGSGFDPRLTAGGVAEVLHDALRIAPGLADATLRDLRVGLRPATPDGEPLLGPVRGCAGLWSATGMGPSGLTIGPYCGRLVADAILGRPAEIDLAPFDPTR